MTDRMARIRTVAACVVVSLFASAAANAGETVVDEHTLLFMAGQPAGKGHTRVVEDGDEIRLTLTQSINIARMGATVRQTIDLATRERTDGTLVSFEMRQMVAAQAVTISGRLAGGVLTLTSDTMGQKREREIDWPEGTIFGYAMEKYVREHTGPPGTKFTFKTYAVDLDRFVDVTYEVVGEETIDVMGKRVKTMKSLQTGMMPGVTVTEYRDAEGTAWKSSFGLMGITIEILRVTKKQSADTRDDGANFDAVSVIFVRTKERIPRPRELDGARYVLRMAEGSLADLTLDGTGQKLLASGEGDKTATIEVTSVKGGAPQALRRPISGAEFEKCLQPSTWLQCDDPGIKAAAERVAGDVENSYEAAKLLEGWVYRSITSKNFDRGFATAKEVLQDRTGDCTEHAVLLCALLRAIGIPSRAATGLVYIELPPANWTFGYHMWTEAYVGEWVPLDGTMAGPFTDATHIRLAASDMAGMSPAAGLVELVQVFGQLSIDVEDYSIGGTWRVDTRATSARAGRYHDPLYDVSFAVPRGWKLERGGMTRIRSREIVRLVREGGGEKLSLYTGEYAPDTSIREVLSQLRLSAIVKTKINTKLGGRDAVRVSYTKRGAGREAVVTKRVGTAYVLRVEPASDEGRAGLDRVVESFRFE